MRVLVVEDDEGIADGLRTHLRQHGEAVDVAADRRRLGGAAREPFDLVLLDLGLPDGDGSELLAACATRHRARCPTPPRRC